MATIALVINAVNNASKTFDAVAASAGAAANRIDDLNAKIDVTSAALEGQSAAAGRAADQLDKLALSASAAAAAQKAAASSTAASGAAAGTAYIGWARLLGTVTLFGGAAHIQAWHLALDVLAEIAAIVIPAGVALGAFGVAASDAVNNVVRHFTSLHTVMDATGQAIWPMTGALEALHQAVQPDVYQVLGDALLVANTRMGEMKTLAMGTGQVLDQLAARASVALESAGVSQFLKNAVPDVAKLGDIIGNIFGTIGNLLKTMPGYAAVLLNILDGITKGLEAITGSGLAQGVIRLGLSFHGAWIYMGLAATAVLALQGPLTRLGSRLTTAGLEVASWGESAIVAGKNGGILAGVMDALSVVPVWGWVAVGAAALAGLVFWLGRSKSATQQWIDQLQAGISSQTTWTGLLQALGSAHQQVGQQITQTAQQLAQTQEYVTGVNLHTGQSVQMVSAAYTYQTQKLSDLRGAQQQFSGEQSTATTRLAALSKQVGGTNLALGLMAQAHINVTDAANGSAKAWALDVQQVLGLEEGLRAMADYAAGGATTSLQVLDQQATDQYQAIQSLNSAWDTFTGNYTKTQLAFDTYMTGLTSVSTAAKASGATMDGLKANSIALNQAFSTQVANVSALYDTWRTAGIASDLFTTGVKASIAPLLSYAKGSQEATDQLVGLAEQAGYQGPASLSALTSWLGKTSDATKTLKNVSDQATQQAALLTGAMHAQGSQISGQLIGDINQAILKYDGVAKAAQAYGQAVAQDGRNSDAAKAARQTLINDLIKSGQAAHDSAGQIAAMITKVLGIPAKRALQLVMTGEGTYSVFQQSQTALRNTVVPAAHGTYVARGRRGVDDQLILAQRGELVVPAAMVSAGLADHLRGHIPGFANGGLVDAGNTSVLSGQYAVTSYDKFQKTLTDAVASALKQALSTTAISGDVASYRGVVLTALQMLGQPLTDLSIVLRQIQTESGGAASIVNRNDQNWLAGTPSVGALQVIGPTYRAYAGPFLNTGPFEYGVSTNPLANVYAGLNYAIHRYGPGWTSVLGQGHGYASGGIIAEPVAGIGLRSGSPYSFGENGPEMVVPGAGRGGPLFTIGEMHVHDEADVTLVAQRLSGMIRAASLGGGFSG